MGRGSRNLPHEVFLSHSSSDHPFAGRLATRLRRDGVRVWYSPTNILGAQQWHDEIGAALQRCDWFAVILSPAAIKSEWVKRELLFALNQARFIGRLIPLLFRPCAHSKLSWTLATIEFVDFTRAFELGYRDLLRVWGQPYRAPRRPARRRSRPK